LKVDKNYSSTAWRSWNATKIPWKVGDLVTAVNFTPRMPLGVHKFNRLKPRHFVVPRFDNFSLNNSLPSVIYGRIQLFLLSFHAWDRQITTSTLSKITCSCFPQTEAVHIYFKLNIINHQQQYLKLRLFHEHLRGQKKKEKEGGISSMKSVK